MEEVVSLNVFSIVDVIIKPVVYFEQGKVIDIKNITGEIS